MLASFDQSAESSLALSIAMPRAYARSTTHQHLMP